MRGCVITGHSPRVLEDAREAVELDVLWSHSAKGYSERSGMHKMLTWRLLVRPHDGAKVMPARVLIASYRFAAAPHLQSNRTNEQSSQSPFQQPIIPPCGYAALSTSADELPPMGTGAGKSAVVERNRAGQGPRWRPGASKEQR